MQYKIGMKLHTFFIAALVLGAPATAQVTTTQSQAGAAKPAEKPKAPVVPKATNPSPKTPLQDPGAVFAGLAGSCWQAPMDDGHTDTHCITAAFNGKLVTDVHKVRNANQAVVYEGVTVYRPDAKTRSLTYEYSNSFGNRITGQGWREGSTLNFSSQRGTLAKPETSWKLTGGGYEVAQADPKAAKLQFRKIGPAGQGF
jgi:hypothetical protein